MKMILRYLLVVTAVIFSVSVANAQTLNVATVNNGQMIDMQKLTKFFEQANPGIEVKWTTLEEGILRQRLTTDITTKSGQFDVMTIGMYETPIWGKKKWLLPLNTPNSYDVDDMLPAIRDGLSVGSNLYALPFYGESSFLMYRTDLARKARVEIKDRMTWGAIYQAAKAMHDPSNGVYGICLRGKPGWGDNMAFITTLANSFGARWFDEGWKPQLTSGAWKHAIEFYVDLLANYGPPGSSSNSFNEIVALFNTGKCAMWIDATSGATHVTNKQKSQVWDKVGYAQAPVAVTHKGSNWLWAWALAIPASSKKAEAAKKFIYWATSKEYVELVGKEIGWNSVPTGTRKFTYSNSNFLEATNFAADEIDAINSADPNDSTLLPSPYIGVQFAAIPEFQAIGIATGQQISAALAGQISVDEALEKAQTAADREMRKAGYY